MTIELPELMKVLDHADAARDKRTALINATLALNTGHQAEDVVAGVDQHLAQPSPTALPVLPPSQFNFGWARPQQETERARKEKRHWASRIGRHSGGSRKFSLPAKRVGFGTPVVSWFAMVALFSHSTSGGVAEAMILGSLASTLFGLLGLVLCDAVVDTCAGKKNPYREGLLDDDALKNCLACPRSRAYLKALRASGVPQVLEGDLQQLEALSQATQQEIRARHEAQQAIVAQQARQQQLLSQGAKLDQWLASSESP